MRRRLAVAGCCLGVLSVAALRAPSGVAAPPEFPLLAQGVSYPVPLPLAPVPSDPRSALMAPFTGQSVVPVRFPRGPLPPRHPFMAANERSNIHDDAYQTDAYSGTGPLGKQLRVRSALVGGECASVTFDHRGRIVSVCVGPVGTTLQVIDPVTLSLLASYPLPTRVNIGAGSKAFGGGGYFYLDNADRAVVPTNDGRVVVLAIGQADVPTITRTKVYDLRSVVGSQTLESALPDWSGRLWFVTTGGLVGIADANGTGAKVLQLRTPAHGEPTSNQGKAEPVGNSFAVDESGGVFIVSEEAQYRLDADRSGAPRFTWRIPYNRGTRTKPGQVNFGSGTTPTLIGSASSPRGGYLAILDNADPFMHIDIYARGRTAGSATAPVCSVPIFKSHPNAGSDENSLIVAGDSIFAENNYGTMGAVDPQAGTTRTVATTVPGLERVDFDRRTMRCSSRWLNDTQRVPTAVSKVATGSGLLFTYTHPAPDEITYAGASLPAQLAPDVWRLTAVDIRSGRTAWSQVVGIGTGFNNFYAPVTIGPDGTAYVGVLGGIVAVRDGI